MLLMVVTLEVSKLSGWLKADATCRVEGRACDAGGERCEPGGGRAWGGGGTTRGMTGSGPAQGVGAKGTRGAHAEHVVHAVTLEVSKLSGWLKAYAPCRVRREGMRCEGETVRAGRRESRGG